jgi:hypothetical protein
MYRLFLCLGLVLGASKEQPFIDILDKTVQAEDERTWPHGVSPGHFIESIYILPSSFFLYIGTDHEDSIKHLWSFYHQVQQASDFSYRQS